jgi:hypothetical protein
VNNKTTAMKTILQKSLVALLLLFAVKSFSQITTTNNWTKYTVADGLISDNIYEVMIQDTSNIWLATDSGLTHFDGTTFSNYKPSDFLPVSDIVSGLVYAQGKVWMKNSLITQNGSLMSFDDTSFVVYSTANGMAQNTVRDIVATNSDTLWITSGNSGVSKFDGTSFTHYPTIRSISIAADSANRVYASFILGRGNIDSVAVYENGIWTNFFPAGFSSKTPIGLFILKASAEGEIFAFPRNTTDKYYYKVSYPLNLELKSIEIRGVPSSSNAGPTVGSINKLNNKTWFLASRSTMIACSTMDSIADPHFGNDPGETSINVDLIDQFVAIATTKGLYISSSSVKPSSAEQTIFDVNTFRTGVRISDPLFEEIYSATANLEFPKNSGNHVVYAANFIVAAKKQNASNFNVFPLDGFQTAFAPGPISNTGGLVGDFILKITKQEITTHQASAGQPNYNMPDAIKNWPAFGDSTLGVATDLAPFFDANSNGCYDPHNGDYPIIKGDQAIYWINHPLEKSLELEYHWMMYGFSAPGTALDSCLFVQYTIVNRAQVAYDSVQVGLFLDTDLGNAVDDYVGCDSINNVMYSYNGTLFDAGQGSSPGYGNSTPAVGVKFLSDSMSSLIYYNIGPSSNGDPATAQDWLNYMNARWKNGMNVRYGGNGFNSSGTSTFSTTHMFTGDPVALTGWTELTPGGGVPQNATGDRRLFGAMPFFSLQPNERKTIEIVVGVGKTPGSNTVIGQNINAMVSSLNKAKQFNDSLAIPALSFASTDTCSAVSVNEILASQQNSLSVFPVPSSGDLTIEADGQMRLIEVYDMKGARVMSMPTRQNRVQLSLSEYRNGFYLIRVQLQDDTWMMKKIIKQ